MNRVFLILSVLLVSGAIGWAQDVDMGDLPACDYPTLVDNPGHYLSDIAWLGQCITGETSPNVLNQDLCDDGVTFLNTPWTPCTMVRVRVKVTGGLLYPLSRMQGERLYLNAWKDGNHDGDFCDTLCNGRAPEWIIQDTVVVPGEAEYTFLDPGVTNMGWYEGVFRFRLTSQPVGPYGFGWVDRTECDTMTCGSYAYDHLGEVEDYIIGDMQLAVELDYFDADAGDGVIALRWATVSETDVDRFEIERNGIRIAEIRAQGTRPAGGAYDHMDTGLDNGQSYSYTLLAVNLAGVRQTLGTTSATPHPDAVTISEYALFQNYPNPFNGATQIAFDMRDAGYASVKVFNMEGKLAAVLAQGNMDRGHHVVSFDANHLPSGLYICRMETAGFVADRKMVLLK
jgi:hypothetical protein